MTPKRFDPETYTGGAKFPDGRAAASFAKKAKRLR
jgi:hypothetical protein